MLRNVVGAAYFCGFVIGCVSVVLAYTVDVPFATISLSFFMYLAGLILLRIKADGKE